MKEPGFFSTKRLDFYDLHGSRLLSFIQKTVPKTICSEHESYQMLEDMATSIPADRKLEWAKIFQKKSIES